MPTSIEKISLIALAGIFIAVLSLFLGQSGKNNNLIEQSGNSSTAHPESVAVKDLFNHILIWPVYILEKMIMFRQYQNTGRQ